MRRTGEVETQLQAFLPLALDGGEWSASHPVRFIPTVTAPVPAG